MMLLPLLTVILLAVILLTTIQLDITDGLITTTDTRPFQTITNPATSIHLRRRLLQDDDDDDDESRGKLVGYVTGGGIVVVAVLSGVVTIISCCGKVKKLLRQNRQDAARVRRMMDGLPLPTHKERVKGSARRDPRETIDPIGLVDPLAELSAFEQDEETPEEKVYNDMKIYATDYLHQLHQKAITAPTDSDSDTSDTTVNAGPSKKGQLERRAAVTTLQFISGLARASLENPSLLTIPTTTDTTDSPTDPIATVPTVSTVPTTKASTTKTSTKSLTVIPADPITADPSGTDPDCIVSLPSSDSSDNLFLGTRRRSSTSSSGQDSISTGAHNTPVHVPTETPINEEEDRVVEEEK